MQAAIENYSRTTAQPQPPAEITIAVIHPPPSLNMGVILGKVYTPLVLLLSLVIGTTFVPQLLIEEKEKKTLWMLMVTPASFGDVLLAKLLVVLVYQFLLTCIVLAMQSAFTGQIGLILLYAFLGACFSMALGLLFGAAFDTVSSAAAVEGIVIVIYIIAGLFVGPLGDLLGGNTIMIQLAKLLPTYYIADGVFKAAQSSGSFGGNLLDIGVILGSTLILLAVSAWILRRQSAVTASI